MCFGGIFDIFLYELSREKQVISMEPIQVGGDALPPVFHVNTCAAALAGFRDVGGIATSSWSLRSTRGGPGN